MGSDIKRVVFGKSTDTYFRVPEDGNADFCRMREMDDGRVILTLKKNDRDDLTNRVEEEITCAESPSKVYKWLRRLLSKESGKVTKEYWVYWFGENEQDNISCYTVQLPYTDTTTVVNPDQTRDYVEVEGVRQYERVILEVEARSEEVMTDMVERITREFKKNKLNIEKAPGSLYSMFILGQR